MGGPVMSATAKYISTYTKKHNYTLKAYPINA